jgi:hypothetical protein
MLNLLKNLFKKEKPKKQVRVCNRCGHTWEPEEGPATENSYGFMLCPDCLGIDTQVETDWHRMNKYKMIDRRKRYVESLDKKEEIRKSA